MVLKTKQQVNNIQNDTIIGLRKCGLRGNYAGIGYIWDEENQIFWSKKPYTSWIKNTSEARWQSPIGDEPALTAEQTADVDNKYHYDWNEDNQSWDLITTVK